MKVITTIIILTLIIVISAFAISLIPGKKEQDYELAPSKTAVTKDDNSDGIRTNVEIIEGNIAVHLPENIQQQAGIEVITLEQASHVSEQHTFGEVVNIQPLLEFRSRYNSIQSDKKIAESALLASKQEYDRSQLLHNEASNISDLQLQQAKSKWIH